MTIEYVDLELRDDLKSTGDLVDFKFLDESGPFGMSEDDLKNPTVVRMARLIQVLVADAITRDINTPESDVVSATSSFAERIQRFVESFDRIAMRENLPVAWIIHVLDENGKKGLSFGGDVHVVEVLRQLMLRVQAQESSPAQQSRLILP